MQANRNLKSSVFSTLFGNPDVLRDLYCALEGVSLPPDVPVSINTLENVLVMEKYNDVSFEIGGKLVVLLEHQSTINPNMALRFFLYFAEILKRMVKGKRIYSTRQLIIPWPEFYVLYNGVDQYPDNSIIKLSDLFDKLSDLGIPEKLHPLLELEVKVININEGKNEIIVNRCKELSDYSKLIASVRSFLLETDDLEEAVKEAIKYCQRRGILKEFLEKHSSEVFNMLYQEWNLDDALAVAREEAFDDGIVEGHAQGIAEEQKRSFIRITEEKHTIARNALAKGSTPEFVHEITGLSLDEIAKL